MVQVKPIKKGPKCKERCAASIIIYDAADMTSKGRIEIANWLHDQARQLLKEGKNYDIKFTSRYLYQ